MHPIRCVIFIALLKSFTTTTARAEKPLGNRIREELEQQNLALVDWSRGTDHQGNSYVELTTSNKKAFADAAPWDGTKELQIPMEKLVQRARDEAGKENKLFSFEGLMINPCKDDASRRFVTVWFQKATAPDYDDIMIHLLLNGEETKTTRRSITSTEDKQLEEHGIPDPGEQAGTGPPSHRLESKSEVADPPQPETEGRSR